MAAIVRTALIILALLLGWTALRHQGLAHIAPIAGSVNAG
jgi:hypothetical protein